MIHIYFNAFEALLWVAFAVLVPIATKAVLPARDRVILAIAFVVFGVTDFIEIYTGAWWEPWWLLCMKGLCVIVFLYGIGRYHHFRKRR